MNPVKTGSPVWQNQTRLTVQGLSLQGGNITHAARWGAFAWLPSDYEDRQTLNKQHVRSYARTLLIKIAYGKHAIYVLV